jgi:hypothetical protein
VTLAIDGTPQSSTGNNVGGTVTYTLNTSQSNDIVIVASNSNSTNITGITGPGLSFTRRSRVAGSNTTDEWYAVASSPLSSASIVITYGSSGQYYSAAVFAISGANTSTIWDSNGGIPVTGATAADPTFSTTNANDIVIGYLCFSGSTPSPTAGSGWTQIAAPSGGYFLVQYQIFSSPQSGTTCAVGTGSGTEAGYIVDAIVASASAYPIAWVS